jgi:hypothetical protein
VRVNTEEEIVNLKSAIAMDETQFPECIHEQVFLKAPYARFPCGMTWRFGD